MHIYVYTYIYGEREKCVHNMDNMGGRSHNYSNLCGKTHIQMYIHAFMYFPTVLHNLGNICGPRLAKHKCKHQKQ